MSSILTKEGRDTIDDMMNSTVLDNAELTEREWNEVADFCCSLSASMAWISRYADMRGAAGCGDHGHEEARKYAAKGMKKVRKALGYSYP